MKNKEKILDLLEQLVELIREEPAEECEIEFSEELKYDDNEGVGDIPEWYKQKTDEQKQRLKEDFNKSDEDEYWLNERGKPADVSWDDEAELAPDGYPNDTPSDQKPEKYAEEREECSGFGEETEEKNRDGDESSDYVPDYREDPVYIWNYFQIVANDADLNKIKKGVRYEYEDGERYIVFDDDTRCNTNLILRLFDKVDEEQITKELPKYYMVELHSKELPWYVEYRTDPYSNKGIISPEYKIIKGVTDKKLIVAMPPGRSKYVKRYYKLVNGVNKGLYIPDNMAMNEFDYERFKKDSEGKARYMVEHLKKVAEFQHKNTIVDLSNESDEIDFIKMTLGNALENCDANPNIWVSSNMFFVVKPMCDITSVGDVLFNGKKITLRYFQSDDIEDNRCFVFDKVLFIKGDYNFADVKLFKFENLL